MGELYCKIVTIYGIIKIRKYVICQGVMADYGKRKRKQYKAGDIVAGILMWIFMILLAAVPVAVIVGIARWKPAVLAVPAVIIVICIFIPVYRALFKRRKFWKRIKKLYGGNKNVKITAVTPKYRHIFKISGTTDVVLETEDTVFNIMYLPSTSPKNTMILFSDAKRYLTIKPVFLGHMGGLMGFRPANRMHDFGFDSKEDEFKETKKIVLLNPVPGSMMYKNLKTGDTLPTGSGERIADFSVENIESLVRTIDRTMAKNRDFDY